MAKSEVKFGCGCGFITDNPLEAALHCDSEEHTLTVLGRVLPTTDIKRRATKAQHHRLFGADPIKL